MDDEPSGLVGTIRESYDRVALEYAKRIYRELENKPFDRKLLDRFVSGVKESGKVCDMGCGPGHVARYLQEKGVRVCGLDISPGMIEQARKLNPEIRFEVGNILSLDLPDQSLSGITSFYSICNFPKEVLGKAFREMNRVLQKDGLLLIAFHNGDRVTQEEELWGIPISMKFFLHEPTVVRRFLEEEEFIIVDQIVREPYAPEVEYQSQRTYIFARK